ncbi:unnamed protein product [Absidia cylindrospora]
MDTTKLDWGGECGPRCKERYQHFRFLTQSLEKSIVFQFWLLDWTERKLCYSTLTAVLVVFHCEPLG